MASQIAPFIVNKKIILLFLGTITIEMSELIVIGGGLAGSEAAWQAAKRGVDVSLYEMRPGTQTGVHRSDRLAELVCSNSFGSQLSDRASGLLKEEMTCMGSLLIECAQETSLPAGAALAVDREAFAELVTEKITSCPKIHLIRKEIKIIPDGPVVIATGPLTSPALAAEIKRITGRDQLYFFDAVAPIVTQESIDMGHCLSSVSISARGLTGWRLHQLSFFSQAI